MVEEYRLEPAFDFTSGPSILLRKGTVEVNTGRAKCKGGGEARLELLPRADIYVYGTFLDVPVEALLQDTTTIASFSFDGRRVEGFPSRVEGFPSYVGISEDVGKVAVKWSPNREPFTAVGDDSTYMTRVVFHLFNFVGFFGTRRSIEKVGAAQISIEHVDLADDYWKVEIRSLPSTREDIKAAQADGGYRLTHVGSVGRGDGSPFSGGDALKFLSAIRFFLSFAKGAWSEPVCAVGFDAHGGRVWETWSSPHEPGYGFQSWFDPHTSSQMTSLFPTFMRRWAQEDWCQALREVIYWYLNANHSSRGIDAGIILTQAAIERLSYEHAVKDKRLLSVKGFKDLSGSDKFRLLFSSLELPLDIRSESPELVRAATKETWIDAPHALTEIRNSLVHPEHKRRGQLGRVQFEAWNLGLWYLEMSILAICGYSGTYGDRRVKRWVGEVENVPWN